MSTEVKHLVAQGRRMISDTLREVDTRSQQGELSIADIRHLRRLTRLGHHLDALEDGSDLPYSPSDQQARDFLEDTVDRIEALGEKADAKQLATMRRLLAQNGREEHELPDG